MKTTHRFYYQLLFFVILAFALKGTISFWYISNVVSKKISDNSQAILDSATSRMRSLFSEIEIQLSDIAMVIEHQIDHDDSQEVIQRILLAMGEKVMTKNEHSCLTYKGLFGEIRGEQMDGLQWTPLKSYNVKTRPWYFQAIKNEGKICYSEPYFSVQTNMLTVAVSKELFTQKGGKREHCGVISLDIDLGSLSNFVKEINVGAGYVILLDANLNVIAHYKPELLGRSLRSISMGGKKISELLKNRTSISDMRLQDSDNIVSMYNVQQISNGWYIISVSPVTVYYRQIYQIGLILFLLGLTCASILCFFLTNLYREKERADLRNRSKTSFLAKMSHEIRTPMNAILGMSELILQDKDKLPPKSFQYAVGIKRAGTNLLAIINDVLDLSKIESGKMEIVNSAFSFASLLNDVINIIHERLHEKTIKFLVFVDPRLPENLYGNVTHLRQILLNLLNNAAKYTREGFVSFDVYGEKKGQYYYLSFKVTDSGVGIKDEDKSKLFYDYIQLESTSNLQAEGTGLGLAITRDLLQLMGGTIVFDSEYEKGSTFIATIPIIYQNEIPFAFVEHPESQLILLYEPRIHYAEYLAKTLGCLNLPYREVSNIAEFDEMIGQEKFTFAFIASFAYDEVKKIVEQIAGIQTVLIFEDLESIHIPHVRSLILPVHSLNIANLLNNTQESELEVSAIYSARFKAPDAKILIVDDNAANLTVIEGFLSLYEMQLDFATNGLDALDLVKQNDYDLIFMDHMMPGMDGIETTKQIRQLGETYQGGSRLKTVPIIALTANAVSGMRELFLQHGMNDFLAKPIDINKLTKILMLWIPLEKLERTAKRIEKTKPGEGMLFSIPGVDTSVGLSQTGGTVDGYVRILESFVLDTTKKMELLATVLEERNWKLYETYVHSFKGILATIGASPLSMIAAELERAAMKENADFIFDYHLPFMEKMKQLYIAVNEFLELFSRKKHTDELTQDDLVKLKIELTDLKEAIQEMRAKDADTIMESLLASEWKTHIKEKLDQIDHHILFFELDEALALIDSILNFITQENS